MALLCVSSSILGWCVQTDGVLDSVFVGCVKAEHPHGVLDAAWVCLMRTWLGSLSVGTG